MNSLRDRVPINPDVMMGKPTIRGLRITVEQILKALAAGVPAEDLLEEYPELEPADLQAVRTSNWTRSSTSSEKLNF